MIKYLFFSFLCIINYNAFGQTNDVDSLKSNIQTLEEISLTANKFPTLIAETGQNINIIGQNILERSYGENITNIINNNVSAIQVIGANSNFTRENSLSLRGANNNQTLILIDGIPVYDPTGIGSAFELRFLSAESFSKVEILKGSQSTLYGSDAVAGVVNLISKQGNFEKQDIQAQIGLGNLGAVDASADVSTPISKNLSIYASFSHRRFDGISEAKDTTSAQNFDNDKYQSNQSTVNLLYKINDNISLKPFIRINTLNADYDDGAFRDNVDNNYEIRVIQGGYSYLMKLQEFDIKHHFSVQNTQRTFNDNSPFTAENFNGNTYWSNLSVKHTLDHWLSTVFDFEFRSHAFDNLEFQEYDENFALVGTSDSSYSLSQFSPSLHFLGNFDNKLFYDLGARYIFSESFDNQFTYSFKLNYAINPVINLFGGFSTAYKTPSIFQLYSPFGNRTLQPENGTTYELGLKGNLTNTIKYSIVGYQYFTTNAIGFRNQKYENFEKQNNQGIEVDFTYNIHKSFSISSNYAYTDAMLTTKVKGTERDTAYNNLGRIGGHKINLIGTYVFKDIISLTTNISYVSNRNDVAFLPDFSSVSVMLDPYFLWNAYINAKVYRSNYFNVSIFGKIKNITNSNFEEVYGFSGLGTNFLVGIVVDFNN